MLTSCTQAASYNSDSDTTVQATGFFSKTGTVAGTFLVVGLIGAGLLIGGLFFVRRKKRQRALNEDLRIAAGGAGDAGAGTSRFQDDEEDDDFDNSTNAHGAFKGPAMAQYGGNGAGLPPGAGLTSSSSYYGSPTLVGSPSMASNGYGSMMGAASAYGGMSNAGYGNGYGQGYGTGSSSAGYNQAYNDQYAMAENYASQPNEFGGYAPVSLFDC